MTGLLENKHLRIGQLATELRLNPKTIRYYRILACSIPTSMSRMAIAREVRSPTGLP